MFLLVCVILLLYPERASTGAVKGIETAMGTVAPSIVPFLVFVQGMMFSGSFEKVMKVTKPVFKALGLPQKSSLPYIASLFGGYPTGCKITVDMYNNGMLTKKEAEAYLSFCNNGGIIFALSVCGKKMFSSIGAGIIVFIAQLIASILTGKLLSSEKSGGEILQSNKKVPLLTALGKGVASGGSVVLNILSSLIVFYSLIEALGLEAYPFLCGITELTRGISICAETNNLPLAAFFFSFGGMAVMAQTASFAAEGGLSLKKYFLGKIISAVLAFAVTYIILHISGTY